MTSSVQRKILDTEKVNLSEHFPLNKVEILFGKSDFCKRQTNTEAISFENTLNTHKKNVFPVFWSHQDC